MEPGEKRMRMCTNSEIDKQLNASDSDDGSETSSLFSSDGESEYLPSSNSNDDSCSDVNLSEMADVHDISELVDPDTDRNENNLIHPEDEVIVYNVNSLSDDPNVQFITNEIHNDFLAQNGNWTNTNNVPPLHDFIGQEKVNLLTNDPVDIFSNIFDNDLLNKIVTWTNKKAIIIRGNPLPKYALLNKWENIDIDELKKFLGLCMLMGNINLPSIKHYWTKGGLYEQPAFRRTMSRNRFESILRCVCFYDPDTDCMGNRMHKIQNVLNHILENSNKVYGPGKSLSLDEAMILFRGRLSFRQYIKSKAHKYGIKLYELTTSDGYILNIIIYQGKGTLIDHNKGHTFEVVKKLMHNYIDKGHILFLDNFYNSVELSEYLMEHKTNMCGTLQANRYGNPKVVVEAPLKRGGLSVDKRTMSLF